jgi:predicted DNA-binding transcriptional regulator AlpA
MPDVMEIPDALALDDRFMFDEDLTPIDKMGRSARRNAINRDGYPKPRRVGLRSAWLLSEVLSWMRAKPHADPHHKGAHKRKALSEGIKQMRAAHGQPIVEANSQE